MSKGRRRLNKTIKSLDLKKTNRRRNFSGILGTILNGVQVVEVPNRNNFVYVRLRDNQSELIQAFNKQVAPVYNLPVIVHRDELDVTRYEVIDVDKSRYDDWGGSSFIPKHAGQHMFSPDAPGGDIVWAYGRQLVPLLAHPSGTSGACNVVIEPYHYYQDGTWKYGGGTGTADLCSLKPTDGTAKMVLIYLDSNSNPQLLAGSTFSSSLTGTTQVLPFVPTLPTASSVPIAWVRLVSGTSRILWDNLYDARPWMVGDGVFSTGTSVGHIIADEGTPVTNRPILNFVGTPVFVTDSGGMTNIIISGSSVSAATLAEAQAGTVTDKFVAPSTLPLWVRNGAIIRRDGTGSYGNNRGDGAVDLQRDRTSVLGVAAAPYSSILAGSNNQIQSGSSRSVILGGSGNIIFGTLDSIVGGQGNYISGSLNTIIVGSLNIVDGWSSAVFGDSNKVSNPFASYFSDYGLATGWSADAFLFGMEARSSSEIGQKIGLTWSRTTSDATPTEMFLEGDGAFYRARLKNSSVWAFSIIVSAKRTDATGEAAGYKLEGVIQKDLTNASVALVGSVTKTVLGESTAAWDVNADADTTNGSLRLMVTGEGSKTIKWQASAFISNAP